MEFIEYFASENKEHWLSEIEKSDWGAAKYLHYLLKDNKLEELVGEGARVLMLVNGTELVSFCTLAKLDDVQPTTLTPWIGWVYTFPHYRGNRYSERLISHAESIAKQDGANAVHISTNHVGLYEKFGYEFLTEAKDVEGEDTRVYKKNL